MDAYNDAYSRALVMAFKEAIGPLMQKVAPDWLLHHISIVRQPDSRDLSEVVEIRLVIKPIGSANVINPNADLNTGLTRLHGLQQHSTHQ